MSESRRVVSEHVPDRVLDILCPLNQDWGGPIVDTYIQYSTVQYIYVNITLFELMYIVRSIPNGYVPM